MSLPYEQPHLLSCFAGLVRRVNEYRNLASPIKIDGHSLSISAVVAVARHGVQPELDSSETLQDLVKDSREVVEEGVRLQKSIYGVTTGIGASANTRSDDVHTLSVGLLQQLHCGILPSDFPSSSPEGISKVMPEPWSRGAILLRVNSMTRGFSGVRWDVIDKMWTLLRTNVIPVIPLLGSISASGDLIPLGYVAGAVTGHPRIKVFCGAPGQRKIASAQEALSEAKVAPLIFQPKEPLAVVNGTSFSTAVASLAAYDAAQLALLTVVCTAFAHEALLGSRGSFDPFLHDHTRPHPGQVQISRWMLHLLEGSQLARDHDNSVRLTEDKGILRQDRYPLRTFPQYVGPQLEDIHAAIQSLSIECNAASDNPVVETKTKTIHLGGNFQAMSVANAMEKTRLALDHLAKVVFGQTTEILSAELNKGLAPGLAATDPSVNYAAKGLDVALAAYVAELGFLANPVSPHAQFAENFNEAVNSMALVSARATCKSNDILTMLLASYLYILCQAVDLRVMHRAFFAKMEEAVIICDPYMGLIRTELSKLQLESKDLLELISRVNKTIEKNMLSTATMDLKDQMQAVASATIPTLVTFFVQNGLDDQVSLSGIASVSTALAAKGTEIMSQLQHEFLAETGSPIAPAESVLGRTKAVYNFIRVTLGIRMHGSQNLKRFDGAPYPAGKTMGEDISTIYESIIDGRLHSIVAELVV
ncbi:hypothetical protein VNI00_006503 [Paramarasmius palmivorus]|uniref:Phenylalanine ammonia-lyase n=1 Tax=Paramarasmius palmivorus TaxID=297713 RepID=A0AAW0DAQ7_9AGAR